MRDEQSEPRSAASVLHTIYVGTTPGQNGPGGRQSLSTLLHAAFGEISGDGVLEYRLPRPKTGAFAAMRAVVAGCIDGASSETANELIALIDRHQAVRVFLDGSNLGYLARAVRRARPTVKVFVFFHNCEARFFLGAFRRRPTLRSLAVLIANWRAERMSVVAANRLVCLNERDSELLSRLYGRQGTDILPMALVDRRSPPSNPAFEPGSRFLFVGGLFYANLDGIRWFARHVAPRLSVPTSVLGNGMERHRQELESSGGVEVVGRVEDLGPWYAAARCVIAPIFDGSGMKTKVAEALMHGKRVIGTPEAFCGYEDVAGKVGVVCRTPGEFEAALVAESRREFVACDPALRAIYLERYSFDAAKARLAAILDA